MKDIIIQDPEILGGKPIIASSRMSVETILELISSGLEIGDILKEYPYLTKEQVQAAVDYAAKIMSKEERYIFTNPKTSSYEIPS